MGSATKLFLIVLLSIALGFIIGLEVPQDFGASKPFGPQRHPTIDPHITGPTGPQRLARFTSDLERALTELRPTCRQDAVFEVGQSIEVEDFSGALGILRKRDEKEVIDLSHFLLGQWAEIDPSSALAYALATPGSAARENALNIVFEEWVESDPTGAFIRASNVPGAYDRSQAINTVLGVIASKKPDRAWDLLLSIVNFPPKRRFQATMLRRWAETDPERASDATKTLAELPSVVYVDIARNWVSKNLDAALKWARSIPFPQARNQALRKAVQEWAKSDIQNAATYAASEPACQSMLDSMAQQWANHDLSSALNWATNLPAGTVKNRVLEQIIHRLAKTDPRAALNEATALDSEPARRKILADIGAQWAQTDPEAASAWATQLTIPYQREFGKAFLGSCTNQDMSPVADVLMALRPAVRNQLVGELASKWANQNLSTAVQWLESLPVGDSQRAALDGVLPVWCRHDPEGAASYVLQSHPSNDDNIKVQYLRTIGSIWGGLDPESALNWDATLPEGPSRTEMLDSVFVAWAGISPVDATTYAAGSLSSTDRDTAVLAALGVWSIHDQEAAAQWSASLQEGQMRDMCARTVANEWAQSDPKGAANWLASLDDSTSVQATLQKIVADWFAYNSEAASAWLQGANIPTDLRNTLLSSLNRLAISNGNQK